MRIKHFKPDGEQLPTSFWFLADKHPVRYEIPERRTVIYHFYFPEVYNPEEIMKAANRVFCRQPEKNGEDKWTVKKIEELETENSRIERTFKVTFN